MEEIKKQITDILKEETKKLNKQREIVKRLKKAQKSLEGISKKKPDRKQPSSSPIQSPPHGA